MKKALENIINDILISHEVTENFERDVAHDMVEAVIDGSLPYNVFYNAIVEMAKHAKGEITLRNMKYALNAINFMK